MIYERKIAAKVSKIRKSVNKNEKNMMEGKFLSFLVFVFFLSFSKSIENVNFLSMKRRKSNNNNNDVDNRRRNDEK